MSLFGRPILTHMSAGPVVDTLHDHFLFLYAVALADFHLDPSELQALYEIGTRRGVSKAKIDEVLLSPHTQRPSVPDDVLDRVECLYDFALIVQADGVVQQEERRMLEKLCGVFGFEDENAPEIAGYLLGEAASGRPAAEVRAEAAATL
ncbi:MAG TPA: TerB family tellurite resistance protein [Rhodothermales bacterium]|nr:TerB family tellurite resistance protein [Rhodothermales bacterium]